MFILLFASLSWAVDPEHPGIFLRQTEIPEELVCWAMVKYRMPCHVTQTFESPRNISRCDLYYAGILYECNVVFNTYAPPVGSVLEGYQWIEVEPGIWTQDIGVRGSSHRYPLHDITTIRVGESK